MLIVYDSKTGNVERFIEKTKLHAIKIVPGLQIDQPYILVTYTTGFGQVPSSTTDFLINNDINIIAVAVSGNMVWGKNYGNSGVVISNTYEVPLIMKFELSGTDREIEYFKQEVQNFVREDT